MELYTSQEELTVDVWGEHGYDEGLTDFTAPGELVRIAEDEGNEEPFCIAVVALTVYPALEYALNCYIARRQREILEALER